MKQFFHRILATIDKEIESAGVNEDINIDTALYMVEFIRPLFERLREYIASYTFQDKDEEISFFKNVKPVILSKLLYTCY